MATNFNFSKQEGDSLYRYARADELELDRITTLPVKRRHQLVLRFYSGSHVVGGWTQAQHGKNVHYVQNDRQTPHAPMFKEKYERI